VERGKKINALTIEHSHVFLNKHMYFSLPLAIHNFWKGYTLHFKVLKSSRRCQHGSSAPLFSWALASSPS